MSSRGILSDLATGWNSLGNCNVLSTTLWGMISLVVSCNWSDGEVFFLLPLHDNLFQNQRDHNLEVAVRRPCRDDDFASGHEWPIDARTLTSREGRRRGDGATGSGGFGHDPGWSSERSGCRSSPDFQQVRRLPARTTSTSQGLQSLPFLPKSLIEPGGAGSYQYRRPGPLAYRPEQHGIFSPRAIRRLASVPRGMQARRNGGRRFAKLEQ